MNGIVTFVCYSTAGDKWVLYLEIDGNDEQKQEIMPILTVVGWIGVSNFMDKDDFFVKTALSGDRSSFTKLEYFVILATTIKSLKEKNINYKVEADSNMVRIFNSIQSNV